MTLKGKARAPIKALPSREELLELFDYDPDTGIILWRPRKPVTKNDKLFNTNNAGKHAGTVHTGRDGKRYRVIGIRKIYYLAHRIIWKIMTGDDPQEFVDHRDTDRLNNRWDNLRLANNAKNLWNSKLRVDNTSGVKGVQLRVRGNCRRYRALVSVNKKLVCVGNFATLEEAALARAAAIARLHGEYARA